jgi:hypothetical protein
MQSQTERDMAGLAARKERQAVPAFVSEEDSKAYDIDERRGMRARRPTDKRIEKLEEKQDKSDSKVDDLDGKVDSIGERLARVEGTLETIADVLIPERREAHKTVRARIDSRTKVIIAIVGCIGTAIGAVIASGCS